MAQQQNIGRGSGHLHYAQFIKPLSYTHQYPTLKPLRIGGTTDPETSDLMDPVAGTMPGFNEHVPLTFRALDHWMDNINNNKKWWQKKRIPQNRLNKMKENLNMFWGHAAKFNENWEASKEQRDSVAPTDAINFANFNPLPIVIKALKEKGGRGVWGSGPHLQSPDRPIPQEEEREVA